MTALHPALRFLIVEGTVLAALFFFVSLTVALLQQGVGDRVNSALRNTSLTRGSFFAATAGAVTPFCSCSTVPILTGMLQAGVRFGVCFTFLIASPVINEGVLLVLLREQSLVAAGVFLITATALSVALGVALDRAGMANHLKVADRTTSLAGAVDVPRNGARIALPARLRFAAGTAAMELRSAAPYLAMGILAGAVIFGYVPQDALASLHGWLPGGLLIVVMALVGVPFYVNAAMVVPIAIALLDKGLGIGPVTAFLVSAAGTSIPEMIMLTRLFKLPLLMVHVISIVVAATTIGFVLDFTSRLF